jgi:hypothetical protein
MPSAVTRHRGLVPIFGDAATVAAVTQPVVSTPLVIPPWSFGPVVSPVETPVRTPTHGPAGGIRPFQPGGDYWTDASVTHNELWSDPTNWSMNAIPNGTVIAYFSGTYSQFSNDPCTTDVAPANGQSITFFNGYNGLLDITQTCSLGTIVSSVNCTSGNILRFDAATSCTGLSVTAGMWWGGNSTLTYTGGSGTINVPSGQTFITNCSDFIDNGSLNARGNIQLGNSGSTAFLSIGNGGSLNLSANGSFAGSGSSNVRVGDRTNGGGFLSVAASISWTSSVSFFLRGSGQASLVIYSGATLDFTNYNFSYADLNSCLAVNARDNVSMKDGSTLDLAGYAVFNGTLSVDFVNGGNKATINDHAGIGRDLVMLSLNTSALYIGQGTGSGYGTLNQNTRVVWLGGEFYTSAYYLAGTGEFFSDNWQFGATNELFIGTGNSYSFTMVVSAHSLPDQSATRQIVFVPYGVTYPSYWDGTLTGNPSDTNGWSAVRFYTLTTATGYGIQRP